MDRSFVGRVPTKRSRRRVPLWPLWKSFSLVPTPLPTRRRRCCLRYRQSGQLVATVTLSAHACCVSCAQTKGALAAAAAASAVAAQVARGRGRAALARGTFIGAAAPGYVTPGTGEPADRAGTRRCSSGFSSLYCAVSQQALGHRTATVPRQQLLLHTVRTSCPSACGFSSALLHIRVLGLQQDG